MMGSQKRKTSASKAETANFFSELEQQIVQRIRTEASSDEGRKELLDRTGLHDEELLAELTRLGITADGVIALRLFPLVLVAWADGTVEDGERSAVMTQAVRLGIGQDSTAWILLHQWLMKRPPSVCVDAWRRYIHETFSHMSHVAQSHLIEHTEKQMMTVANASGGHLGIGKVSKREHAIIRQIIQTMRGQALSR